MPILESDLVSSDSSPEPFGHFSTTVPPVNSPLAAGLSEIFSYLHCPVVCRSPCLDFGLSEGGTDTEYTDVYGLTALGFLGMDVFTTQSTTTSSHMQFLPNLGSYISALR